MTQPHHLQIQEGIRNIVTAVSNVMLYSVDHPQVKRQAASAALTFKGLFENHKEIDIILMEDKLIAMGIPLANNLYMDRFTRMLKLKGIQYIKFRNGITEQEIDSLIIALAKPSNSEFTSSINLSVGTVELRYGSQGMGIDTGTGSSSIPQLNEMPDIDVAKFMEIYEAIKKRNKISAIGLSDIVSGFISNFKKEAGSLFVFAPLRMMDEYTFTHSTNVCIMNIAQAMSFGIDGHLLHDIGIAALLHDIGKLFVPEEIINKPGKLTDEEWDIIRQHPVRGAQQLLDTPGIPRLAVVTAYEHHMKYDLSGYPRVNAGWQQNLCSNMTTISDFFDAMRTKRSYRGALEWRAIAGNFVELSGKDFHPVLTKNFINMMDSFEMKRSDTEKYADNSVVND